MSYYGSDYINSVLGAAADVTITVGTDYYNSRLVPESAGTPCINYYRNNPVNMALNYGDYTYTVNCRADDEFTSITLAGYVSDAFNRIHHTVSGAVYFGIVSILPTIPPVEDGDTFNTPVEIQIKSKE